VIAASALARILHRLKRRRIRAAAAAVRSVGLVASWATTRLLPIEVPNRVSAVSG
jgi:hypothetical protein